MGNKVLEIPLNTQHPLRSALLSTRDAYGKAVAESIEARLRVADVKTTDGSLQILNLSRAPEREEDALTVFSGGGKVTHVCTTNAKYVSGEKHESVWYSETFDSSFWEAVAINSEPGLVLCDGSLSDIHQVQMLKLLFPAVASGGIVVLQQPAGSDSDNALVTFANYLVAAQLRQDKHSIEASDATGYLLRNVEVVSFAMRCVILRKRKVQQQRLEAVPFSTVALGHVTLDTPTKYSRIPAQITAPERIKQRNRDVLAALVDITAPAAEIGRLKNAIITGGGIVHTPDGYIVEESFINARHSPRRGPFFRIGASNHYVSERSLEPVREASGQFALIKQTWDANYGHWIVDTLPRMDHYASHMDLESTGVIVNGSVSPALQQMQADGLRLFGVSPDNLLPVDWQPTRVEDLLYVTPSSIPPLIKSPRSIEILESLAGRVDSETVERFKGHERIYLTRNAYPRRRLLNEDKILPVIKAAGYRVIEPESLTFQEQIALFSQASHVVGNMGAAFSNLAFSPRGVRVLMLATEHMLHDYFYDLVCHKDGEYVSIQGTAASAEPGIGADFTIDEESFSRIFAEFDPRF
jgi:hypothetical protein